MSFTTLRPIQFPDDDIFFYKLSYISLPPRKKLDSSTCVVVVGGDPISSTPSWYPYLWGPWS
jgi:hypothetical protein